jgi:hypothetical protein
VNASALQAVEVTTSRLSDQRRSRILAMPALAVGRERTAPWGPSALWLHGVQEDPVVRQAGAIWTMTITATLLAFVPASDGGAILATEDEWGAAAECV